MKIGDLIWDDEVGQYGILISTISADGDHTLYYFLFEDGDTGYRFREDVCLVHGMLP